MKVYMEAIDMIAWFDRKGKPTPIKFRMTDKSSGEEITVSVKVRTQDEEKLAGNRMIIFKCQSFDNDVEKILELKYEINTCKWFLYKM